LLKKKKAEPPKKEEKPKEPKEKEESSTAVQLFGGFVGTALLTFLASKYLFKLPQRTTLIATGTLGVVGAVTGYFLDKKSDEKDTKK